MGSGGTNLTCLCYLTLSIEAIFGAEFIIKRLSTKFIAENLTNSVISSKITQSTAVFYLTNALGAAYLLAKPMGLEAISDFFLCFILIGFWALAAEWKLWPDAAIVGMFKPVSAFGIASNEFPKSPPNSLSSTSSGSLHSSQKRKNSSSYCLVLQFLQVTICLFEFRSSMFLNYSN